MYERMLNRESKPSLDEIYSFIGPEYTEVLNDFERFLNSSYDIATEIRFPFGSNYGWGIKFSHRTRHLCYVFPEKGSFTVTLQIGGMEADKLASMLGAFLPRTRELWKHRYPCGKGGWVHYRVLDGGEIEDIKRLIELKKKPCSDST